MSPVKRGLQPELSRYLATIPSAACAAGRSATCGGTDSGTTESGGPYSGGTDSGSR